MNYSHYMRRCYFQRGEVLPGILLTTETEINAGAGKTYSPTCSCPVLLGCWQRYTVWGRTGDMMVILFAGVAGWSGKTVLVWLSDLLKLKVR